MSLIKIVSLLVTVLVSTRVSGQVLDANGCLTDGGFYNATSNKCECQTGYDGVGDLCCTPISDNDVCFMKGDPCLRSVAYQIVNINIPCSVCVNVMEGETQSGKECVWEILSSSTIRQQGAMYTDRVKIAISVNKKSPTYFMFDGTSVLDPVTNQQIPLGADGTASATVEDETIQLSYASTPGLWNIEGCGNKVIFRPKVEGVSGQPGLCMLSPKGSSTKSLQQGNLCNLQSTFDSTPWKFGVLDSALNMRQVFTNIQRASPGDYDQVCRQVDELMGSFCQGISKEAMDKCGVLLYNADIRYCLDAGGVKGPQIAGLFQKCLAAYCDGESQYCDGLKSSSAVQVCIPSLTSCDQWPYYFE